MFQFVGETKSILIPGLIRHTVKNICTLAIFFYFFVHDSSGDHYRCMLSAEPQLNQLLRGDIPESVVRSSAKLVEEKKESSECC